MPVVTDVHEDTPLAEVASVVDVLQTPAFLCRQTNFIQNVAAQNKPVNIKKGQFLSPWDMQQVVNKALETGNRQIMVCERGASFGYNNLVSDMRSLAVMRATGCPVVFDATHSVQLPGGQGSVSGGQREFVPVLARAAVAAGVSGLFMETHPNPEKALSDGPNAWPLAQMESLLEVLMRIDQACKASELHETALLKLVKANKLEKIWPTSARSLDEKSWIRAATRRLRPRLHSTTVSWAGRQRRRALPPVSAKPLNCVMVIEIAISARAC